MEKNSSYIHIENLSKSYGYKRVLNAVNINLEKGDIVAVIGPNGAGKTTLIRILSTLIKKESGDVRIAGLDLSKQVSDIRKRIGLLSHENFLYPNLTVYENLSFFGKLYNTENLDDSINSKLVKLGIADKKHDLVRNLSSGMKQRVSIARAVIHDPEIIFLDEPFVGLDIEGVSLLGELIEDLMQSGKTVLVTSHDIKLLLQLCSRVIVLHKGEVRLNEPTANLDIQNFETKYKEIIDHYRI